MMTFYVSPYRRMAAMREAMNHFMEENWNEPNYPERDLNLAADVYSEGDDYVVRAMIPGLEADDLSIEVLNNTITLRGEFKAEAKDNAQCLTRELPVGRFGRTITLPTALDPAKAEASIRNGLLTLRVTKAEAHRPRTIKITAN